MARPLAWVFFAFGLLVGCAGPQFDRPGTLDAEHGEVSKDADGASELYPKSRVAANRWRGG